MAFAPSFDFVAVPSRASIFISIARCSKTFSPLRAGAMILFTFSTALRTPFPPYRFLSPSRSSRASFSPVEAPEGTAARPRTPFSRITSTSTVGFPRESMISRPITLLMAILFNIFKPPIICEKKASLLKFSLHCRSGTFSSANLQRSRCG